MDEGNHIVGKMLQGGKTLLQQFRRSIPKMILTSPITYIVLAILALLLVVAGAFMADEDINTGEESGYTNVGQSNFSGQDIVDIAKGLHDYIRENNYAYSCSSNVSDGYSNKCIDCGGASAFGKNTFEQFHQIKCIDCSAFVSWVLNQYLGDDEFPTRWWSGDFGNESKWPTGWRKVNINDIQAGDILWKSGHVGIYIGDGRTVEAGGTNAIRKEYSYGNKQAIISGQYAYTFGIRIQ